MKNIVSLKASHGAIPTGSYADRVWKGKRGTAYNGPLLRITFFFRCYLFPACVMCLGDNGKVPHCSDLCNRQRHYDKLDIAGLHLHRVTCMLSLVQKSIYTLFNSLCVAQVVLGESAYNDLLNENRYRQRLFHLLTSLRRNNSLHSFIK